MGDEAEHLHRQRRHQYVLRHHDHRHATDDAVAFGIDREQPAAGGGLLDRRNVAQQPGELHQERRRIGPLDGEAGLQRHLGLRALRRYRRAGLADDHAGLLDRLRQNLVVARQAGELLARLRIEAAEAFGGNGGRHAVGLGENDVEADDDGAERVEPVDEIGHHGARPRPLPDLLEARLVDVDDDDGPRGLLARPQHLKQIERAQPHFLERPRVDDAQRHQREQEHDAHRSRQAEPTRPADDEFHGSSLSSPALRSECREDEFTSPGTNA